MINSFSIPKYILCHLLVSVRGVNGLNLKINDYAVQAQAYHNKDITILTF